VPIIIIGLLGVGLTELVLYIERSSRAGAS
jgi:hypothetical protein